MKKALFLLFVFFARPVIAQVSFPVVQGSIAASSSNCSTSFSCVWQTQLSANASTATINISGTFSATLIVEESNNSGQTWSSNSTISTTGTTTYNVNGFTDIRVRCTAYTSGIASITINTGLLQVQSISSGSSAGVGQGAAPVVGWYLGNSPPTTGNTGQYFYTLANTQTNNTCSWTSTTPLITCNTVLGTATTTSASVNGAGTLATIVLGNNPLTSFPTTWAVGNSITVSGFTGGDTFFNGTFTISAVTSTSVSYALTHATATSSTIGIVTNTSIGPFVPSDATLNKVAWGWNLSSGSTAGCNPYRSSPGAVSMTSTHLSIASYVSSTQLNVSANPTNANTGTGCFIWGTPDDAAAMALENAYSVAGSCPRVTMAAGNYMFLNIHFTTNPLSCRSTPFMSPFSGAGQFGNMWFYSGLDFEGRGVAATIWYIPPGFPETGSCINGPNLIDCFYVPLEARYHEFAITSGDGGGGLPANKALIGVGVGSLEYFSCAGVGNVSGTRTIGVQYSNQAQALQVDTNSCGSVGQDWDASTGGSIPTQARGIRLQSENATFADFELETNGQAECLYCVGEGTQNSFGFALTAWYNNGGTLKLTGGGAFQAVSGFGSTYGINGYLCATAGCVLYADGANLAGTTSGTTATNGILCNAACTNYLSNTILGSQGTGVAYQDFAGSKLFDNCGNTFTGTVTINGTRTGVCSSTGSIALTGTGACATNSGPVGFPWDGGATCTGTTGAATMVITPGASAPHFWRCDGADTTTGHLLAGVQVGVSTTTCTLNFTSVTNGDVVTIHASPF